MSAISLIRQDRILVLSFSLSFFLILISFGSILLFYNVLPPYIPLFNQLPPSDARLGTKMQFFIPPGIALALGIVNIFLSEKMYKNIPLISRIIGITGLIITFFVTFFVLRTLQLIL